MCRLWRLEIKQEWVKGKIRRERTAKKNWETNVNFFLLLNRSLAVWQTDYIWQSWKLKLWLLSSQKRVQTLRKGWNQQRIQILNENSKSTKKWPGVGIEGANTGEKVSRTKNAKLEPKWNTVRGKKALV